MLSVYLEKSLVSKLDYRELLRPNDQDCILIANSLFDLIAQQHFAVMNNPIATHARRLFGVLFGSDGVAIPLRFGQTVRKIEQPYQVTYMQEWSLSEQAQ